MSRAIQIRGLRYQYPDGTQALNGIDFISTPENPWRCSAPTDPARPPLSCT